MPRLLAARGVCLSPGKTAFGGSATLAVLSVFWRANRWFHHRKSIHSSFIHPPFHVERSEGFDAIGIVADWIDACKRRHLGTLLDLYADEAIVEC
jgi:hypothetical protein